MQVSVTGGGWILFSWEVLIALLLAPHGLLQRKGRKPNYSALDFGYLWSDGLLLGGGGCIIVGFRAFNFTSR